MTTGNWPYTNGLAENLHLLLSEKLQTCDKDTKEWGGAWRIWEKYLRGIKESGLSQNCDYFTKKKPPGQYYQRDLYSVDKPKTVSLTWLQPLSMLTEAPGVTSAPPWAAEGQAIYHGAHPVSPGASPLLSVTLVDETCLRVIMSISMWPFSPRQKDDVDRPGGINRRYQKPKL